jgi:4-amino-4-deoxy-L-arabinose transferase-like glycosyltransferase
MSGPRWPSGEALAPRARLALIAAVLVILALRLVLAAVLPLTEDEAYYRLWSEAPAFGYFDHPPMIAWMTWLGRQIVGDGALGVRLLPSVGCAVLSALVFDLARRLRCASATAARAVVWYNATLLVAAGGFLAVPDAPASVFWTACLCAAARAFERRSWAWWVGAGLCAGFAALSKYSSLFLGPGILLWLASSQAGRQALRSPGPWLALVAAAAVFAPNVAWNAGHHWLTFAKQFGRIAPRRFEPRYLAEFVVAQALLLNPVIAAFLARGARRSWGGLRLLAATSLPFVAYLALHSLHDRVQAHWPAPLYAPLAIIAAASAERLGSRTWARLRAAAPAAGFALMLVALAYLALPMWGVPLRLDPAAPLRDWPGFSRRVEALRERTGAAWIGPTSYGLTSQLLAQGAIHAPVMQISERDRWRDLATPLADPARPGLVIDLRRRIDMARLGRCFSQVIPLGDVVRAAPGEAGARYSAVLVNRARRNLEADGC